MVVTDKKVAWPAFRNMELDDDDHALYELIEGIIMRRASPNLPHQRVARRLSKRLGTYLDQNPIGEYYFAPVDVVLDEWNVPVPDLTFVSSARSFIVANDEYIAGAPDIVVEIISPGSVKRDRAEKKTLYEKFGVKEYWLIDLPNRSVEIYLIKDNAYHLQFFLENEGAITSAQLPGFELDLKELFD